MNYSVYRFTLDIQQERQQILRVKKGDTKRAFEIMLSEKGEPYKITDDCYAVFSARKPDGKAVFNNCEIEDSVIKYVLTPQTVAAEGVLKCEIKLYGGDDGLITSQKFSVIVDGVVNNGDDIVIESAAEVEALTKLISDAGGLSSKVDEALSIAQEALEKAESGGAADFEVFEERLSTVEEEIENLKYKPIEILSMAYDGNNVRENGDEVRRISISWNLNKDAKKATINGKETGTTSFGAYQETLGELEEGYKKTTSWELVVKDDKGSSDSAKAYLYFYDGIYYGCKEKPAEVDSAFILSLTKKLSSGKNLTVTVSGGENKYFFYAYPASMGTSIFNIGGFDYEYASEVVSFTNAFGVTKDYRVYVSDNPMLSGKTVTVKGG